MRAEYIDARGITTRVLREGSGTGVLLIHPVGYSADIWLRNIDALAAAGHDVAAPDLIGHGFTDFAELGGKAPQAAFVRHLQNLVDALGWRSFSIIGSSLGSQLAVLMAFDWPRRVERLILVGSGSTFSSEAELAEALPRVMQNGLSAIANPSLDACRIRLRNTCHDLQDVPEEIFLSQISSYARPRAAEVYRKILTGMMDLDLVRPFRVQERLEEIAIPTLIVSGHEDTRAPFPRAVEASKRIERASLLGIRACGHLPFLEHPYLFNQAAGTFLTRTDTPARSSCG